MRLDHRDDGVLRTFRVWMRDGQPAEALCLGCAADWHTGNQPPSYDEFVTRHTGCTPRDEGEL